MQIKQAYSVHCKAFPQDATQVDPEMDAYMNRNKKPILICAVSKLTSFERLGCVGCLIASNAETDRGQPLATAGQRF